IKGRPELSVRVRRGFLSASPANGRVADTTTTPTPSTPTTTNAALNNALNTNNPRRTFPVDAYAVFTNDAQAGSVISASVQLANDRVVFAPAAVGGKQQAQIEVAYALLDDKGKVVHSDGRTLTLNGSDAEGGGASAGMRGKLVTIFSVPVSAPGLYQFRTAARDANSGLVGNAFAWIEVPDLKANRLALSSLLVTERRRANAPATATAATTTTQPPDILRADRRFARMSRALLQLYIYNATRTAPGGAADVELEIKILQDKKIVLSAPPHKVSVANSSDQTRILYVAEVPLGNMTPGVYLLQVTVTDRVKRTTATREIDFTVE
ncbi:MAG: hypothetical protein LC747_05180, partial [Acidobacteria bacterium]|nr:hypothetical protein [Acidobacteriota bacterium]